MYTQFITKILLVIAGMLIINEANADAWTITNSGCSWFTKRYKAHVGIKRAWQVGNQCSDTDRDCYFVELDCRHGPALDFFSAYYARAYAKISDNGSETIEFGGYDGTDYWYAGSDVRFKKPTQAHYPMIFLQKDKDRFGQSSCKVKRTEFDVKNHRIILHNVEGVINLQTSDPMNDFAAIVISLTRRTDDSAELSDDVYMSNLISSSKIFLNNGSLKLKGIVKKEMIKTKIQGKLLNATFSAGKLIIPVPKDISLDDVSVNIGVDNGNLGMGVSDKFAIENDVETYKIMEFSAPTEVLSISNYPNPSPNQLISVDFQLSESDNVEVFLCDDNGNVINTLYKGNVQKGEQKTINDVNIDKIKISGYVKIVTPQKTITKKIMKL
jgi:hypothetical protein